MDEILQYAVDHGIIDMSEVRQMILMDKRKEILNRYLENDKGKIWQGKNGRWYAYIYVDGKRTTPSRTTRKEIEDCIVDKLKELQTDPTIDEMFYEWLDRKLELGKISGSSYDRHICTYNRHFGDIKDRRVKYIQIEEIEDFLERQIHIHNLTSKGFAALKLVTKGIFSRAKKRKLISWNVDYMLSELDVSEADFKRNVVDDEKQVFDEVETEKVVAYLRARPDEINLGILLLFATGLRVGELSALKPEDVGIDYVNVRRTETRYRENGKTVRAVKDSPKSAAGLRTVVVPEEWEWLMKKIRLMNPWGTFLFEKNGKRIAGWQFCKRLYKVCDDLKIVRKSPHKIRKTYGTILLDEGVDRNLIMQQMGHTDILTTERHYHRNRKSLEAKKKILNAVNFV